MTDHATPDLTTLSDAELAQIDGGNLLLEIGIAIAFDIINNYKEYAKEFQAGMNAAMQ